MMTNTQLNRIPSVELQLLTWLRLLEGKGVPQRVDLKRAGFKVHVHCRPQFGWIWRTRSCTQYC